MNGQNYPFSERESITAVLVGSEQYLETQPEFGLSGSSEDSYNLGPETGREAISWRPQVTAADKELGKRFNDLADTWKNETRFFSSVSDIIIHPAHLRIIAIGPKAVPLILDRMKQERDLWFWALNFITGENPVTKDIRGNVKAMSEAWLDWGCKNGHC